MVQEDARHETVSRPPLALVGSLSVQDVPLEQIDLEDRTFQYRFEDGFADLVPSLQSVGQETPVDLLAGQPLRIIDGFRRVRAMRELGWPAVRAVVHERVSEEVAHRMAFVRNVVRRNLSALERAYAIRLARDRGRSAADLARDLGISERQLARYEALLTFPKAIQDLVAANVLSMAHAKALADAGVTEARKWAKEIAKNSWSAKQLRREVRKAVGAPASTRPGQYVRIGDKGLRVYAFKVPPEAGEKERRTVAAQLREALSFLEGRTKV